MSRILFKQTKGLKPLSSMGDLTNSINYSNYVGINRTPNYVLST